MIKKLMITGCALLLLTACGTDTTKENASKSNQPSTSNEAETTDHANQELASAVDSNESTKNKNTTGDIANPPISLNDAVKIFEDAHRDAKIESVDLDHEDGRLHYDIEGFDSEKEYEMEIDATSGEVKEHEVDTDRDNDEYLDFSEIISPAKAIEIASKNAEVEGLSPTEWSLETDDDKQKYTIEYDQKDSDIDIKINAVTGEFLEVDID